MARNDRYSCFIGRALVVRSAPLGGLAPRRSVFMLAFLLLGLALPAQATNVTVGCAGASGGPFNFPSITAALGAISGMNDTITVSGTCTEFVVVVGVRGLRINGTPGAALVDPGSPDPSSLGFDGVLTIAESQGVTIQDLTIRVASRSIDTAIPVVSVEGSASVTFIRCRIEGAGPSDGIDIFGPSGVRVTNATVIENNNDGQGNGEGIFVDGASSLVVDVTPGAVANCPGINPVIQGNGDNGILVAAGGSVRVVRCATIQNNGLAGIRTGGGSITIREPQALPGAIKIQGNAFGVIANNRGSLSIAGPALIQGNTINGVRLRGGSAGTIFASGGGPAGPTIQQNGAGPSPFIGVPLAGVTVAENSTLDLGAALVTGNFAPGVLVGDSSLVRLIGPAQITNNSGGVFVTNLSIAALLLGPVLSGNAGPDLSCSPDSVGYGDGSGVGRMNCPGFRVQPQPGAPVPPGKPLP